MTNPVPDRRLHAWRRDLADATLRGRVAAERFVNGETQRVIVPTAAVRSAPNPDAAMETEALHGEAVRVFERGDSGYAWVQLQADRYVGYIEVGALGAIVPSPTHRVSAVRTPVFSRPDIKSPPLGFLPLGGMVAVVSEAQDENARYGILASGGAVVRQHLAALDEYDQDFVAVAERFLETPYLWGGKTGLGLDCSGLVQVALAACGIAAPRDTDMQQAALGEAVDPAATRRGDLVFWKGHVAIVTKAGQILHANAHAMRVSREPLEAAIARIAGRGLPVAGARRLPKA